MEMVLWELPELGEDNPLYHGDYAEIENGAQMSAVFI